MAFAYTELSLESIKDFMVARGGRVTNHELVKQFKHFLTSTNDVEKARNQFKKYVNTLSNISQEGGEKYLVLKRKYRIGTPLEIDEYPSPVASAQPPFPYHNSPSNAAPYSPIFSSGTPPSFGISPGVTSSPVIPPPYRAPPPYRPPPEHDISVQMLRDEGELPKHSGHHVKSSGLPSSRSFDNSIETHGGGTDHRRSSYQDPHDLGIPPAPLSIRSSSSNSLLLCGDSSTGSPGLPQVRPVSGPYQRLRGLPLSGMRDREEGSSSPSETIMDPHYNSASRTSLTHTVSMSSVSSFEEGAPPVVPPRRRAENKENFYLHPEADIKFREGSGSSEGGLDGGVSSGNSSRRSSMASMDDDRKISVKETTQKFNKMASDAFLIAGSRSSTKSGRNRSDKDEEESPPLSTFGIEGQEWLVAAARSDFNEILRLLKIYPALARYRDLANGYTAVHWGAKHGRAEVIKLLYGTYHVDINCRSNGGYTPLHLSAMYNRHDTFDLLTHYGADLNLRDYSGKKPRQYQAIASSTISQEAQNRIVRRRNSLKDSGGFLRIGSLNVKVRKTTEVFNNLLSRDVEARLHRSCGSSDSLPDTDNDLKVMPPPKFVSLKKRNKTRKEKDQFGPTTPSSTPSTTPSVTPTSTKSDSLSINTSFPSNQDSDSDSAYGFDQGYLERIRYGLE